MGSPSAALIFNGSPLGPTSSSTSAHKASEPVLVRDVGSRIRDTQK